MSGIWLNFVFQLPKDLVLELFRKHYSCSEQISRDDMSIWLRIHFSREKINAPIMERPHLLQNVTLKVPVWKFNWNVHNFSFHTFIFPFKWKSMIIPNLRHTFIQRLHINHQKCQLGSDPAIGRGCYAKWLLKGPSIRKLIVFHLERLNI